MNDTIIPAHGYTFVRARPADAGFEVAEEVPVIGWRIESEAEETSAYPIVLGQTTLFENNTGVRSPDGRVYEMNEGCWFASVADWLQWMDVEDAASAATVIEQFRDGTRK
jgi:hypothetical protein